MSMSCIWGNGVIYRAKRGPKRALIWASTLDRPEYSFLFYARAYIYRVLKDQLWTPFRTYLGPPMTPNMDPTEASDTLLEGREKEEDKRREGRGCYTTIHGTYAYH